MRARALPAVSSALSSQIAFTSSLTMSTRQIYFFERNLPTDLREITYMKRLVRGVIRTWRHRIHREFGSLRLDYVVWWVLTSFQHIAANGLLAQPYTRRGQSQNRTGRFACSAMDVPGEACMCLWMAARYISGTGGATGDIEESMSGGIAFASSSGKRLDWVVDSCPQQRRSWC